MNAGSGYDAEEVEKARAAEREQTPLTDQDFYMDGSYLVFTAAYHRKRGYCCGSGCRHCPYQGGVGE